MLVFIYIPIQLSKELGAVTPFLSFFFRFLRRKKSPFIFFPSRFHMYMRKYWYTLYIVQSRSLPVGYGDDLETINYSVKDLSI